MTRQRTLGWIFLCLAVFVCAGVFFSFRKPLPPLPELGNHPHLPPKFHEVLREKHSAASARRRDPEVARKLAHLYQANRLYAPARQCYRILEAIPPGLTARDHYYLADIAQNAGDLDRAIADLRAAIAQDTSYVPARVNLAETLFKSGLSDEAAKEYAAVVARLPNHPQASLGLARLALQRGDDPAAIGILEKLLADHPESSSAAALLAQIVNRRGDKERAEALTQWSQQKKEPAPNDPWLADLLIDCYDSQRLALRFEELANTGQIEAALPQLQRLEELDSENWLPFFLRGWVHGRAGRNAEAVIEYRRALEKNGDPERVVPWLVPCLLALKRDAEAIESVEKALALRPAAVPLLTLQTDLLMQRGEHTRAQPLLTALLKKDPYLYTANMHLARILWVKGEREAAVACLERVAKAFPSDVASRGLLGQHFLEKGDFSAAIVPLEQAWRAAEADSAARERLSTMFASACLQAGANHAAAGRDTEAISFYEKAARVSPSGIEALANLAGERARLRQFRLAAAALAPLAERQPENPTIQISLGDMLYQDGNATSARIHWEKALALAPASDTALRAALDARLNGRITPALFE